MKTKMFFAFLALMGVLCTHAQETTPVKLGSSLTIGITGGLSTISGNFASDNYEANSSGFNSNGCNIGLTGKWMFHKNWGICAQLSYRQYFFQGLQNLANGFHEAFDVDSASALSKGNSHTLSLLAGPCYQVNLAKNLSLTLAARAGIVDAMLAGWDIILTDAGITHPPLTQENARAITIGYDVSAGVNYELGKHWQIDLTAGYYYSKPDFSITNDDRLANTGRMITGYEQPITGTDINLGLAYRIPIH